MMMIIEPSKSSSITKSIGSANFLLMDLSKLTLLIAIPFLLSPALYIAWLAKRRGRNPYLWGFLSVVFGIFPAVFILAFVIKMLPDEDEKGTEAQKNDRDALISNEDLLLENLRVRSLLKFWLINLAFVILIAGFNSTIVSSISRDSSELIFTLSFAYLSVCPLLWLRSKLKGSVFSFRSLIGGLPVKRHWLRWLAITVGLILFSYSSFYLLWYPLSFLVPRLVESLLLGDNTFFSDGQMLPVPVIILEIFVGVFVVPFAEELIFRGVILQRWAYKWGMRKGIFLSSLLFAFLHADVLGAFFFGVVMAVLYVKTRTLLVPMISHALNNASAYIFMINGLWIGDSSQNVSTIDDFGSSAWIGLLVFVLILPWAIYFIVKNWHLKEEPILLSNQASDGPALVENI